MTVAVGVSCLSVKRIRLPNSSASSAWRAFGLARHVRRRSAGVSPTSVVEMTRDTHLGLRMVAISASTGGRDLRVWPPGQSGGELGELPAGLG